MRQQARHNSSQWAALPFTVRMWLLKTGYDRGLVETRGPGKFCPVNLALIQNITFRYRLNSERLYDAIVEVFPRYKTGGRIILPQHTKDSGRISEIVSAMCVAASNLSSTRHARLLDGITTCKPVTETMFVSSDSPRSVSFAFAFSDRPTPSDMRLSELLAPLVECHERGDL